MIFVEFGDGRFQLQSLSSHLEFLDQIGCPCVEDAPSVLHKGQAQGCSEMGFSPAWRPEEQQVGALIEPGVARGQGPDLSLTDHGHGVEVKVIEGLSYGEAGLFDVAPNAPVCAFGDLVLCDRRQEAGGWPAFFVSPGGEVGPDDLDRREP